MSDNMGRVKGARHSRSARRIHELRFTNPVESVPKGRFVRDKSEGDLGGWRNPATGDTISINVNDPQMRNSGGYTVDYYDAKKDEVKELGEFKFGDHPDLGKAFKEAKEKARTVVAEENDKLRTEKEKKEREGLIDEISEYGSHTSPYYSVDELNKLSTSHLYRMRKEKNEHGY